MYPNAPEARRRRLAVLLSPSIRRALPSRFPGRVVDLDHRPRLTVFVTRVDEYVDRMQPAYALDDRLRDPVEHDEAFLAILDALARDNEHRCIEFRHLHFIVPLQSAYFLLSQPRVHLEERHTCEVIGQLLKQERLFFARERIG